MTEAQLLLSKKIILGQVNAHMTKLSLTSISHHTQILIHSRKNIVEYFHYIQGSKTFLNKAQKHQPKRKDKLDFIKAKNIF